MFKVIITGPTGEILLRNIEVETLVEGIDIIEEFFADIEDSDNYMVDFNAIS